MAGAGTIGIGLIGVGRQAVWAHVAGIQRSGLAEVAAICDSDAEVLAQRGQELGLPPTRCFTHYAELIDCPAVQAVVIATPNDVHAPAAIAAAQAGKHILCEKPLALSTEQASAMLQAARRYGVRHMTAFTYRFVPALRYLEHLVRQGELGPVRVVRSRRLMDFPDMSLGWRQERARAGSGELGDMASHRIDFVQALAGPIRRVQGLTRLFVPVRRRADGSPHAAEVEDWTAFIGELADGAVAVFESCKLCRGYGRGDRGVDDLEVNGAVASAVYHLRTPEQLELGRCGGTLSVEAVPAAFRGPIGAGGPLSSDPWMAFRENQMYAFLDAIRSGRECTPSFLDGARAVAVVEAVQQAAAQGRAIDVPQLD